MEVTEIVGFVTGLDDSGVNFLDPKDAFKTLNNGYVYRQELKSRKGFVKFADRLSDGSRVMGIFENVLPDGTLECLVCSKDFLYTYNSGTNSFDQIPFNSASPIGTFGISNNEDYVSGTTYLTKAGGQRFVLTGKGMSDIYFYDGTDVKRFTNTTDNPDYQAPASGALTKATHVRWFGERLNFFVPVVGGVTSNQGILFSAIRDSSGNGDKFNSPGAGLLQADTYENMKGVENLGDILVLAFERSNWELKKTRDAFNPYFVRKIPSVLGTDASFSTVSWNYEVKSVGKTGLLTTDGRQTLRFDNKLPFFTSDEIDQAEIELTYGGFERVNSQFLFSYLSNTSTLSSQTQDKVLVYNYKESTFATNDMRFSVFGQTDAGQNLTWNDIDENEDPSWARMDETEEIWNKIGIGEMTQKTLAGDDLGFVYEINKDFDDYFVDVTNISKASSAVVTVDASAFQVGDTVIFANVEGMTEINGLTATISAASTTSITVNIDSTDFTTYSAGGTVSKLIDFEAETIPFNPYRPEGSRVYMSHVDILVNTGSGTLNVEFYSDEEEAPFKTAQIIPSTETTKARQWFTVEVNQESDFITTRLYRSSVSNELVISSIRIHSEMGGMDS